MKDIDYSVVIRTLGKANEKYQGLLNSIKHLEPQPKEVIVVLPEGFALPEQRLGYERFCFCKKGMIQQRLVGINECKSEFALICDDDVAFDSNFIKKLYMPISLGLCELSIGPLLSFFVKPGLQTLVSALTGASFPMLFHKDKYVSIKRCGGWSYNRRIDTTSENYYLAESAAWTCFFGRLSAIKSINLDEELWIEAFGYASHDDQTMFYKGYLKNIKTMVVSNALYEHLDAKTSVQGINPAVRYSAGRNKVIFWHRFIFNLDSNLFLKGIDAISFIYVCLASSIYSYLDSLIKKKDKENYKLYIKGLRDGFRYLKTKEYKNLPKVIDIC